MRWRPDRRVDVAIIDRVRRVSPDVMFGCLVLGSDVLGENTVVVDMVMVTTLLFCHGDLREPFDHSTANVPRHEEPNWVTMVWVKQLPIHHEREHARTRRVQTCLSGV